MMEFPFAIINRREKAEYELLKKKNVLLEEDVCELTGKIKKMQRGERVCGNHCKGCANAFEIKNHTCFGDETIAVCKLDAANTCKEFQPK